MSQIGFYYNQTMCAGCKTCQVACKDKNRLDVGPVLREVRTYERGTFPDVKMYHFSAACNHCTAPACVPACATGALSKLEDGTVLLNPEACIGCGSCTTACPYGAPRLIETTGVTAKCDACVTLREEGYNPACVDACPYRAFEFGEIEDLRTKHPEAVDSIPAMYVNDSIAQTGPNAVIDARAIASDEQGTLLLM